MIGKKILHYRILAKLGEGGMGVVYKAEDTKLERIVALKFLPTNTITGAEEKKRFEREAKAAAALNHPNIATIHAIEEHDDVIFIVMEFIDGKELRQIIKSEIPNSQSTIEHAIQISEGLKAAHEKGIMHRDIKSTNIMLTEKGQIKIMDFGLAKIADGAQLTKDHSTLGTAAYMSPEQVRGEPVDQRTDIWSFGVVLYEMLTGQLPFGGEYEQAVIYSILNEGPEPLNSFRSDLPPYLELIAQKALAKDLNNRYRNMREVISDLRSFGQKDTVGGVGRNASSLKQHTRFSSRHWYAISAIFLIILAGIVFYYFSSSHTESIDTLAILPFINQSADPEMQYLSDGIPETLIFQLAQLPNLKIRSLNSVLRYSDEQPDIRKLGSDLQVQAVLTGRVSVRNERLAVVVELVDTEQNNTIWGNTYNRKLDDLLMIQREITEDI